MLRPGKVTREYLDGKRAAYIPPLRTYLSISVVYFLTIQLFGSEQVLFISFDGEEKESGEVGVQMQYWLFFLVPLLAAVLKLLYVKRRHFYVEFLVFAVDLHSVWFVLFSLELVLKWLFELGANTRFSGALEVVQFLSTGLTQILPIVYLVISLKRVFRSGWLASIGAAITSIILYVFLMAGFVVGYSYLRSLSL